MPKIWGMLIMLILVVDGPTFVPGIKIINILNMSRVFSTLSNLEISIINIPGLKVEAFSHLITNITKAIF